jgi:hypothetical protein
MEITVANHFKWSPFILSELFLDDFDSMGLEFWYNAVVELNEKMKD